MNIDEAVRRACEEPTLPDALSYICVWDCDRAVRQALDHQRTGVSTAAEGSWDTCFKANMKAVTDAWGRRGPSASGGCRYLKVASTSESVDHDCELEMGMPCEGCPIAIADARVADIEGLYAAAVGRLRDLGETEVPLTTGAAEDAGLRCGDVVEVVRSLSTYHLRGSRVAVTRVSERGDFTLATGDAATPVMAYGFAYRPHVKVVRRKTG